MQNAPLRVGLIGLGHVGANVRDRLEGRVEFVEYDISFDSPYPTEDLALCDLAIVCVPTPTLPSGACDTAIVEKAVSALPVDLVWVRSTVPPGTCDRLAEQYGKRICFSPEYVGETRFSEGYELEDFLVLGGAAKDRRLILELVMRESKPPSRIHQCSNTEAELVKYMENAFLAAKVGIVAEFYELSERLGLDWFAVREAWLADPRIGRAHSQALPHDLGYGGKCLPKDVSALCAFADEAEIDLPVMNAVRQANQGRRSDG